MKFITTIKDLFLILKQKSLKQIFFGNKVYFNEQEQQLISWIKNNPKKFAKLGGRTGNFVNKDLIHQGKGTVYLFKNTLVFDADTKIRSGPDLWVYLSNSKDPRVDLGKYSNLGLLKGTTGGQSYQIKGKTGAYKSVIIYCKKFSVLFTYALLKGVNNE